MENDVKRFVKKSIIFSCVAAVVLVTAGCVLWTKLPGIYQNRIVSMAQEGEVDQATAKLEELKLIVADDLDSELLISCKYAIAEGMYNTGRFVEARQAFRELEGYSDSAEMIKKCSYGEANSYFDAGDYTTAAEKFLMLGTFSDSNHRHKECLFLIAEERYKNGDVGAAISDLLALGDFLDADKRALEMAIEVTGDERLAEEMIGNGMSTEDMDVIFGIALARENLKTEMIAAGREHSVALYSDGTVAAVGSNQYGQCDVSEWKDITAVCAGSFFTLGLKSDGTVVATGDNKNGQCDVSEWTDVVKIIAGHADSVALRKDGTILTAGYHDYSDMLSLESVKDIYIGNYQLVCLNEDGSVVASHVSAMTSQKPIAAALSTAMSMYIMSDGVTVSSFERMPQWENMIYVTANSKGVIGITSEGEIKSFFFRDTDKVEFDLGEEKAVAVSAGGEHYLVLTESGNIFAFGENSSGQCDVSQWKLW